MPDHETIWLSTMGVVCASVDFFLLMHDITLPEIAALVFSLLLLYCVWEETEW